MNKQAKKFTLATISALSLLGAGVITANQASASEHIFVSRDESGSLINLSEGSITRRGLRVMGLRGTYIEPDKQNIIDRINKIRKEAYNEGIVQQYVPVSWSDGLENSTMARSAEASLKFAHQRLDESPLFNEAHADGLNTFLAENVSFSDDSNSFNYAIDKFYEEKQFLKTGNGETGHYLSLVDPVYTKVGMSAFVRPGRLGGAVAQWLSAEPQPDPSSSIEYGESVSYLRARGDKVKDISLPQNFTIKPQESKSIELQARYTGSYDSAYSPKVIIPTNRDWSSSDTSVATIDRDGNVTAHKSGTTTITVTSDGKTYSTTVTVSDNASSNTSSARDIKYGRWVRSGSRWWFKDSDGSYPSNGWDKIDKVWYYFDSAGWMQTGWVKDSGNWYYLGSSGAMKTGWLKDNGSWYYLDGSGAMKTGWFTVSGKWYYAYSSGVLAINTTTPDGYRVNANGEWV